MKLIINEFDRVKKFLSDLDEYSLVYHKDSDGVCSAVLLSKFLGTPKVVSPNDLPGIGITDMLVNSINSTKKIIFTDLPVDQTSYDKIKRETLIIDHHIPKTNLNKVSNKFIHVNPRFSDPNAYYPASYIVYKISEPLGMDVKKCSWISAVGVIGDHGEKTCKDVIEDAIRDHGIDRNDLNFLSNIIESSKGVKGMSGISEAYQIFLNAESPKDVLESKLIGYYHKYQKEINQLISDFRYHSEFFPETDSYLYEIKSRYNITSVLSTKISEEMPDSAVFVYKVRDYLFISARCQTGRINVGKLMEKLSEGIGSGGGHPQAAAATIPKKHIEEFMERLRKYLEGIQSV
ncbi:MAG: DHH family phosphoesterase [Candidatus Aenigmarchaeota archaeon]|nr:DHH family phosphoesterase [Candidatus Aenigmarchaeota archaeon]